MSAFGVKGPLMRAVVTEDFKYNSSKDILNYLSNQFKEDSRKLYFDVDAKQIATLRKDGGQSVVIPGCVKNALHMICFNPDGSIVAKVNICSCIQCLEGNFDACPNEKGQYIYSNDEDDDDYETDSDVELVMRFAMTWRSLN